LMYRKFHTRIGVAARSNENGFGARHPSQPVDLFLQSSLVESDIESSFP
jgi:hypothetical protein